jgi:hypothetical protein
MKTMGTGIAMLLAIIALGMSLVVQIANAEVFKWVDDKGTVHFTEDPSTIPEKYREQAGKHQRESEGAREKKGHEEVTQGAIEMWRKQRLESPTDPLERMSKETPDVCLSYEWTQEMSLWIKVNPLLAPYRELLSETAAEITQYYHKKKGHLVCVRFYYGNGKVIVRECR